MPFTEEHQNVRDPALGTNSLLLPGEPLGGMEVFRLPPNEPATNWSPFVSGARRNAVALQDLLDRVSRGGGGTVFFPPGRYYLGRRSNVADPTEVAPFSFGETTDTPDILVHSNVVLEFAPGAVLVPLNYAAMGMQPRARAGREDEAQLVIIEVQGAIDAGHINAHHTAAPAGSHEGDESQGGTGGGGADPQPMPPEQFRPSMSWEGPGQLGCHLVALGCCFKNTYLGQGRRFSSSLGGIRLGPNQAGTIFHVANTTADDNIAPDNRRGAFRNTAEAVAPASFVQWLPEAAPGGESIREPPLFGLEVWPVQR